ncbi:hypothetical protein ACOMHN_030665 [Nucella lapillus]
MTNQDENKEAFYQQLDEVVRRVPADDKLIILGDLNTRIDSNHTTMTGAVAEWLRRRTSNPEVIPSRPLHMELDDPPKKDEVAGPIAEW